MKLCLPNPDTPHLKRVLFHALSLLLVEKKDDVHYFLATATILRVKIQFP